tara:strand:+ start:527 stop:700 length:174 start_codon:yes stop_codon:yes gene_type:complete
MIETKYSIDEILDAINEINQDYKSSAAQPNKKIAQTVKSEIPNDALRIIEEAEKNIN